MDALVLRGWSSWNTSTIGTAVRVEVCLGMGSRSSVPHGSHSLSAFDIETANGVSGDGCLIAATYGVNFRHMPKLLWVLGYPLALLMMGVSAFALYMGFRKRGWL